jgi:hypothetical protein
LNKIVNNFRCKTSTNIREASGSPSQPRGSYLRSALNATLLSHDLGYHRLPGRHLREFVFQDRALSVLEHD